MALHEMGDITPSDISESPDALRRLSVELALSEVELFEDEGHNPLHK